MTTYYISAMMIRKGEIQHEQETAGLIPETDTTK